MPIYRATFVREGEFIGMKRQRVHPTFETNATDLEILEKEASAALQRLPFLRGEWTLEAITPGTEAAPANPADPEAWASIAATLRDQILSGERRPGSRLPGHLPLAEEMNSNAATVYRALKHLREQGYVRAIKGRGTFITDQSTWPASEYPYLPGYKITWDANAREWVARSADIELHGRNQDELDNARKAAEQALDSDLSAVHRDPTGHGNTSIAASP
jgi:hypothetical protein